MAWSQSSKLQRYKYYLKVLFLMHDIKCCFCGKRLSWKAFYPKQAGNTGLDEYLVHHKNGNHKDDRPSNWAWAHRTCHGEHNWKQRKAKRG